MRIALFDTETTGLPEKEGGIEKQPHCVQIAVLFAEFKDGTVALTDTLEKKFKPPVSIPEGLPHGIKDADVAELAPFSEFAPELRSIFDSVDVVVAHNFYFDRKIVEFEFERAGFFPTEEARDAWKNALIEKSACTMRIGQKLTKKWPRLQELHTLLFGEEFQNAHDALSDINATFRCFAELAKRGLVPQLVTVPENAIPTP